MGDLLQLKDLGGLLPNQDAETFRDRLADVLQRNKRNFPGAQPVSFSRKHLAELRKEESVKSQSRTASPADQD